MARIHYVQITIMLVVVSFYQTNAQNFRWPRKKAMEIGSGGSAHGIYLYGGYVYFFPPKRQTYKHFNTLVTKNQYVPFPCEKKTPLVIPPGLSAKISLFFEHGSGKGVRYRFIGMDAAFLYAIYHAQKLYVNLKGGVTVSDDALITPIQEGGKANRYNRFKYGLVGGFELEWMLGRKRYASIITGWDQRGLINKSDSWGQSRWYAFAGYRFKIPL